jgi:acetyl-CoA acetyltransferase
MTCGAVAIVGAAETEQIGIVPEMSMLDLHADASLRALRDAGLGIHDVDGIATAVPWPVEVAPYLGITPRWADGTMVGGCSFMLHVRHAAAAIEAGLCDTVLISHGESGRSGLGRARPALDPGSLVGQFEAPYGAVTAVTRFTVPAARFLHDRGMGAEDLAQVVVAQRRWSNPNPRAVRRELATVDDVLAAPMIADPFTRDMCCPVTDGGAALVMVAADRVDSLKLNSPPVYLLGAGESVEAAMVSELQELGSFNAFRRSGSAALAEAGLGVGDIDHLMIYDAFAHVPLYGLEDLGFVARGESGAFIAAGHTSPAGKLPMNTNGGGLNYTHTGMYGMFAIQEAVRQLRGEACVQVGGARTSLVLGVGMMFGAAGCLVLSGERP